MAWTSPMTAVTGGILTASQYNLNVRDNFLETEASKASTAGGYFVCQGINGIQERVTASHTVATSETTTSTSYADMATVGPVVTVETGTTAAVFISAEISKNTTETWGTVSFEVTGATTIAASDAWGFSIDGIAAGNTQRRGQGALFTTLTPGENSFRMKYMITFDTLTASQRHIVVIPF